MAKTTCKWHSKRGHRYCWCTKPGCKGGRFGKASRCGRRRKRR